MFYSCVLLIYVTLIQFIIILFQLVCWNTVSFGAWALLQFFIMVTNFISSRGDSISHRRHDIVFSCLQMAFTLLSQIVVCLFKMSLQWKAYLSPILTSFTYQHLLCRSARWIIQPDIRRNSTVTKWQSWSVTSVGQF